MDQLVMSSESMAPRRPKSAPEAPTETPFLMKSTDRMLPPSPDTRYTRPTFPARTTNPSKSKTKKHAVREEDLVVVLEEVVVASWVR